MFNKINLLSAFSLIFLLFSSFSCFAALPAAVAAQNMYSLAPMLEKVKPSIVNILVTNKARGEEQSFDDAEEEDQPRQKEYESVGSGVIVDGEKGYILTNAHLIVKAKTVTVTIDDGSHYNAKLIGVDPASDVAVIQIKADNLPPITLGDSDQLQVGDFVVAIGNPYGLNQTVTSGIISALERDDLRIEGYESFIQTDAPINPGNSGGALVNLKGELIGINTAILTPGGMRGNVGIGFAIPSNMARAVMDQLVQYGKIERGVVGIMIQTLSPELAKTLGQAVTKGAVVTHVSPDSPAEKVGMKTGDIILRINGQSIKSAGQVKNSIGLLRSGSDLAVDAVRNGKTMKFTLKSADPEVYKKTSEAKHPFFSGVALKPFEAIVPGMGYAKGLQVMNVGETSTSWQAGLRPGDVLLSINGNPVYDLKQLSRLADPQAKEVLVNIVRGSGAQFIIIKHA
jgi:serine protease Do